MLESAEFNRKWTTMTIKVIREFGGGGEM